jgi:hypothetical protein
MKPDPHLLSSLVAPAEGIEQESALFSQSPIEALDWLRELGEIARESIEPAGEATTHSEATSGESRSLAEQLSACTPATGPSSNPSLPSGTKSEDSRLIEALLEYHRLRNPAIRARSAGQATPAHGSSAEPSQGFSPLDIPIVSDASPKEGTGTRRANEPLQTILRPKAHP